MMMSWSVEARVPYLYHKLVKFALQIPSKEKMKLFKEKYILRKEYGKLLPEFTIKTPKKRSQYILNWLLKEGFNISSKNKKQDMKEWLFLALNKFIEIFKLST